MPLRKTFQARCLPVDAWPQSYINAWQTAFTPDKLFDPSKPALAWRPSSVRKTRQGFGVWISWVQQRAPAPDWTCPASLVTRELVLGYVGDLQLQYAPNTVFCRIQELYDAIRIMAPGKDWSWLLRGVKRIRSEAKPVREKLSRLQPAQVIENLGLDLMRRADTDSALSPFQRALMYRDGLAIALLIRRPLRIGTFASIKLGLHLVGDHLTGMAIPGKVMKSKRAFTAAFPAALRQSLERYLQVYRPYLLSLRTPSASSSCSQTYAASDESSLWISRGGGPIDVGAFSKSIARRTRKKFGRDMTPHLFRDAAVTTLVRDAPGSALLTKTVLGHISIDITNDHYNQAQMIESARRYAEIVEGLIVRFEGAK